MVAAGMGLRASQARSNPTNSNWISISGDHVKENIRQFGDSKEIKS
jgi:hypothetical protein